MKRSREGKKSEEIKEKKDLMKKTKEYGKEIKEYGNSKEMKEIEC